MYLCASGCVTQQHQRGVHEGTGSGGVPVKDARSEALWTRLSIQSAVWRQLPATAYPASLLEEILVSLQKRAVVRPLSVVHFGFQIVSSYKSNCVLSNNITS